jgi:hypothetical protein
MFRLHQNERGLSQVVTTLILLVVAVLLTSVVTYYATNITMTRTQQEEARITKQHIWANGTSVVAAFKLQNLGGRDILVDKIEVRDVEPEWIDVYFYRVSQGTTIMGSMNITSSAKLTGSQVTLFGRNYTQASTDIPLASGGEIIFYVKDPPNISVEDVGTTCSLAVFTVNGQYRVECNVESATE